VFPNPAVDRIEIQTQSKASKLEVMDMTGRIIEIQSGDSRSTPLNINKYSKGAYQVKVTTAVGQETATFVKQ